MFIYNYSLNVSLKKFLEHIESKFYDLAQT